MTTARKQLKIRAIFAVLMLAAVVAMSAQRRVTPVERNNNRTLTAE